MYKTLLPILNIVILIWANYMQPRVAQMHPEGYEHMRPNDNTLFVAL